MKQLQAFCKRAQFCGFTSIMQIRVFLAMGELDGSETTARDIADLIGIVPSQVSSVLRGMSDWGLVDLEKRIVLTDGRNMPRIFAKLTNAGRTSLGMMQMEVVQ